MSITQTVRRNIQYIESNIKKLEPYDERLSSIPYGIDIYAILKTGKCLNEYAIKAYEIYKDSFKREIIEALLLADADFYDIRSVFGVHENVTKIYSSVFFDVTAFETYLDKLSYVEQYKESSFGRELKLRALNLGPNFVFFKYGNIIPKTQDQRDMVKKMFLGSAYRAMEANYNNMESGVSKSSLEWAKVMLKAYEAIEKLMTEDKEGNTDLVKILLKKEETAANKTEAGKNIDGADII